LSDELYFNGRLATIYGAKLPADAPFQKLSFEPTKRSGVLTHPYMMAAYAYTSETSPIHRGVFLARGMLGVGLKPPQEAFTPLSADLHPKLTTRERVELQTKGTNCQSCHAIINPLGFSLEQFDAVGKFRETDHSQPINASGSYQTRSGERKSFAGAKELANFLANSPEAHTAFTEQMFHHLVQQSIRAYGANRGTELTKYFTAATSFAILASARRRCRSS
jgi:hypothetical protein